MSGTGKSSALAALASQGFRVVDTDEPGWKEQRDGDEVWRENRIAALLADETPESLFVLGTVPNQGRFYDRFDAVVLLSAPAEVLLERISTRTTNDFGKTGDERNKILADLAAYEPQLRATATHELDATQPLDVIVAALAELGR